MVQVLVVGRSLSGGKKRESNSVLSSEERCANTDAVSEEVGASDAVHEGLWREGAEQTLHLETAACANMAWR